MIGVPSWSDDLAAMRLQSDAVGLSVAGTGDDAQASTSHAALPSRRMSSRPYPRTITPAMRERAERILALWETRHLCDAEETRQLEMLVMVVIHALAAPRDAKISYGDAAATLLRTWLSHAD